MPLPARYRPEARCWADRGKALFLTVMARPAAVMHEPAVPLRLVQIQRTCAPLETRELLALELAVAACRLDPAAGVEAGPVRVYRPQGLAWELVRKGPGPAGGCPRAHTRLVRWVPNLSGGIGPADLAAAAATWQASPVKPKPPQPALRPEPARTKKQGLMPDALRQIPFRLPKGSPGQGLWRRAPGDLRWVAMVVPVVIGLAWYSLTPKSRPADDLLSAEPMGAAEATGAAGATGVAAATGVAGASSGTANARPGAKTRNVLANGKAQAGPEPARGLAPPALPVKLEEPGFFDKLREKISQRAAVEVSDDFRNGLSAWEGNPGWSDGWSYDQAGFVQPGSLALLRPTVHLTDYTFEFLGKIDQRALSWVYRARDTRNYHAGKLVVVQGGPLPKVHLVRYRVVNGREEGRKSIPVPEQLRMETLYRVKIDVAGNDFTTSVLGKVVDTYTDSVHPQGGVGFFSARGEQSKIRWVELSHQYDTVGRLCAFLAPPRIPVVSANEKAATRTPSGAGR